jgi:hypothetical protein
MRESSGHLVHDSESGQVAAWAQTPFWFSVFGQLFLLSLSKHTSRNPKLISTLLFFEEHRISGDVSGATLGLPSQRRPTRILRLRSSFIGSSAVFRRKGTHRPLGGGSQFESTLGLCSSGSQARKRPRKKISRRKGRVGLRARRCRQGESSKHGQLALRGLRSLTDRLFD